MKSIITFLEKMGSDAAARYQAIPSDLDGIDAATKQAIEERDITSLYEILGLRPYMNVLMPTKEDEDQEGDDESLPIEEPEASAIA